MQTLYLIENELLIYILIMTKMQSVKSLLENGTANTFGLILTSKIPLKKIDVNQLPLRNAILQTSFIGQTTQKNSFLSLNNKKRRLLIA